MATRVRQTVNRALSANSRQINARRATPAQRRTQRGLARDLSRISGQNVNADANGDW